MRLHRCVVPVSSGSSAAAVAVLFLLVVQLFTAAQQHQYDEDPHVGLKVTLRKGSLEDASSCVHTFAQLELLNLHPTDEVVIHSIQTAPEETIVLIKKVGDSTTTMEEQKHYDVLPQQIKISRLPSNSLSLGPNQVAIVPVSFLPRFPNDSDKHPHYHDGDTGQVQADTAQGSPPVAPISPSLQELDLADWLGSSPTVLRHRQPQRFIQRSNRGIRNENNNYQYTYDDGGIEEYQVRTTLLVETNRGVLKLPVRATSIRRNDYGLPDSISFRSPTNPSALNNDGDVVNEDEYYEEKGQSPTTALKPLFRVVERILRPSRNGNNTQNDSLAHTDCYDLYIKHPHAYSDFESEAETGSIISDLSPVASTDTPSESSSSDDNDEDYSDRDLQVLEVLVSMPEHVTLSIIPEKEPEANLLATSPLHAIRTWSADGNEARIIPPDDQPHYLATVCSTHGRAATDSVVFVDHDEEADDYLEEIAPLIEPTNEANWLGFLQVRTDMDTLFVGLERATNAEERITQNQVYIPIPAAVPESGPEGDKKEKEETILRYHPESIDIRLISSANPRVRIPIDVYNSASPQPITIMRMSAVWQASEPGLDEKVGFDLNLLGDGLDEPVPIKFNETLKGGFFFECSIDWNKFVDLSKDTVEFTGTVILRGTSRGWSYDEWEAAMKFNPSLDSELVVEIPFSVRLIKGKIDLVVQKTSHPFPCFLSTQSWYEDIDSVSSAFFPLTSLDIRASLGGEVKDKAFFALKSIDHDLRVFGTTDFDAEVKHVEILDDTRQKLSLSHESLCSRFYVSFDPGDRLDHFDIPDFNDRGLVELKYRFPSASAGKGGNSWRGGGLLKDGYTTTCYIKLTTEPDTGEHLTPLIVYSGQIDVAGSQLSPIFQKEVHSLVQEEGERRSIVGFEKLVDWLKSTKAGITLSELLGSSSDFRKNQERDEALLTRYLYGLAGDAVDLEHSTLQPVLLQAGAIAQGEIETLALYLTNHNPIPIQVTIDVGEVEGMSISLAREHSNGKGDGNSLLDHLPRKPRVRYIGDLKIPEPRVNGGPYRGHPLNGLRQFLLTDESAASILAQFPYRDAVSLSDSAAGRSRLLQKMFRTYLQAEFHKAPFPKRFSPGSWSRCNNTVHPPPYGPFEKKLGGGRRLSGPVIISDDGKSGRRLPVCWDKNGEPSESPSDGTGVLVPPGGVARFEVNIRSPPNSALEKDITQFLATGLNLMTNHGEVLPIIVSFEALQGKLDVAHIPSSVGDNIAGQIERAGLIRVPVGLFAEPSLSTSEHILRIPPRVSRSFSKLSAGEVTTHNAGVDGSVDRRGVSLFMESSFSRDVLLREVYSCNPFFEVALIPNPELRRDTFRGVNIGIVKSILSCDELGGLPANVSGHPSFFRCVLSWLVNRADLQPRGCGLLPTKEKRTVDSEGNQVAERGCIERAIRAFKRALLVSEHAYGPFSVKDQTTNGHVAYRSRSRSSDGIVPQAVVDVIADAWDAWRTVSEFGLHALSTSLRAIIEYNSTVGETLPIRTHVLSVALRNLTVETLLEAPKLFDSSKARQHQIQTIDGVDGSPTVVEFPPTPLAKVASLRLPLRNPTAVPIRVRLAVPPSRGTASDSDPLQEVLGVDEAVRMSFVGTLPPPYVQNGKTRHPSQRRVPRDNWWDDVGGFLLTNFDGDTIRSHHNVTIIAGAHALVSLYNPSLLASTAFLIGCSSRCGMREDLQNERRLWSPIGASAALGTTISGRKRSKKSSHEKQAGSQRVISAGGSLHSGGVGPSAFSIPFSALDEIVIPPFGEAEIGPILFRPPGRFSTVGCHSLKESGLGGGCESESFESTIFLENSMTGLERIVLRGKGQLERIDFVDPEPPSGHDSFGNIELRYGRPTLMFPVTTQSSFEHATRQVDSAPILKEVVVLNSGDLPVRFLSAFLSHTARLHDQSRKGEIRSCGFRNFRLVGCETLGNGFSLLPGQNRSIMIQHFADCKQKKDFVALHLEIDRNQHPRAPHFRVNRTSLVSDGNSENFVELKLSRSRKTRTQRGDDTINANMYERIELLLGYDMSKKEFSSCVPVSKKVAGQYNRSFETPAVTTGYTILEISLILASLLATAAVLVKLSQSRMSACCKFHSILNASKVKLRAQSSPISGNNWFAAFRCLARADPTSLDLQTLGREQVRQIVLARYRSLGVLQPQCLNIAGAFHRDRGGGLTKPSRQMTAGREGGNDRGKTLSDATFRNFRPQFNSSCGYLPCEIGWRTALTKGIIDVNSLQKSPFVSKTEALLRDRDQRLNGEYESFGESDDDGEESILSTSEDESVGNHLSGADTNGDELYGEGHLPGKVHVDLGDVASTSSSEGTPALKDVGLVSNTNNSSSATHGANPADLQELPLQGIPAKELNEPDDSTNHHKSLAPESQKTIQSTQGTTKKAEDAGKPSFSGQSMRERAAKLSRRSKSSDDNIILPKRQQRQVTKQPATPKQTERNPSTLAMTANQHAVVSVDSKQKLKTKNSDRNSKNWQNDDDDDDDNINNEKDRRKKATKPERTKKTLVQPSHGNIHKTSSSKQPEMASQLPPNAWNPEPPLSPSGLSLRPPPGLPPPPGFLSSNDDSPSSQLPSGAVLSVFPDQNSKPITPSATGPPASTPDRGIFRAQPDTVSRSLSTDSVDYSLGGGSSLHSMERALPQPLYEEALRPSQDRQDFDIMDFLDGVLNDTSFSGDEDDERADADDELNLSGDLQLADAIPVVPLISSNPWATPTEVLPSTSMERRSRLSAYGISIEDGSERTSDSVNLPLLTPADILSVAAVDTSHPPDEEENYGRSFYANLLGEQQS